MANLPSVSPVIPTKYSKPPNYYPDVPFIPYTVGAVVVALPILYLQSSGQKDWISKYVLLISLMLMLYYQQGFTSFQKFVSDLTAEISGKKE